MLKISVDHQVVREIIENDKDFEVKVKSAILRTACKTMLKQTLDGGILDAIQNQIDIGIKATFGKIEGSGYIYNKKFIPSKLISDGINKMVTEKSKSETDLLVKKSEKTVTDAYDKINKELTESLELLNKKVHIWMDENLSNENVNSIADEIIKNKMKDLIDGLNVKEEK